MDEPKTLFQELTDLLMEQGCAVTKPGIDKLVHFIAIRDQSFIDETIRTQERLLVKLQNTTR
jgi:hypothetical protein